MSHSDHLTELSEKRLPAVPHLLARLREATRAAHDRVEILPELACLLSPDLRPPEYVRALRGLHGFHACLARALPSLLGNLGIGAEAACNDGAALGALEADLAWFGAHPQRIMRKPASLVDAEAALGALYVREGSALGARVIGRAVAVSLRVEPGKGGSFFCGASAGTARQRWQAFCVLLENADRTLDEAARLRVLRGAADTFASLEAAMSHPHEPPTPSPAVLRAETHAWTEVTVRSLN